MRMTPHTLLLTSFLLLFALAWSPPSADAGPFSWPSSHESKGDRLAIGATVDVTDHASYTTNTDLSFVVSGDTLSIRSITITLYGATATDVFMRSTGGVPSLGATVALGTGRADDDSYWLTLASSAVTATHGRQSYHFQFPGDDATDQVKRLRFITATNSITMDYVAVLSPD